MSARPEELCGVKEEPPCHRHSTVCKLMRAKVVLHRLEDLYVSQARYSEHLESACIKDEEEEWSSIKEALIHMKERKLANARGLKGKLLLDCL
ncbi:uncharacterized protein LOC130927678 isoform X5 [Corythoichthys intestinalis]|uniref:uncharacterized protein LOC130927678 isoform X5 n=1 Tax=Corythoichthys intestinalis TaxID=161448 RepID=UPI0025A65941|nr:uncharacterized protein LOC130927678 isoform X5 [Corythoichthys intestinalis]